MFTINHILTASDIAAGYIMLPVPAHPLYLTDCSMWIDAGPVVLPPIAYEIVDQPVEDIYNRLQWRGYSLNGYLEENEHIRVQYIRQ